MTVSASAMKKAIGEGIDDWGYYSPPGDGLRDIFGLCKTREESEGGKSKGCAHLYMRRARLASVKHR